ncbi:MAG: TatD family hydrolase [Pseudomonadota bacterium]
MKNSFSDTHCHLDAVEFDGTQADLVRDAQAAGVSRIVVPSVARGNFDIVRNLCVQYPNCAPAYGIHPMYTNAATPNDLDVLRDYLEQHPPIAVGEIGLDFFIKEHDRDTQEFFFVRQLELARDFNLPVLLHIRHAQDSVLKQLRQHKVRGGIAHAFNGSRQQAEEFLKLGFKLGFGGAMTYPRATRIRELAASLPLDSIVLETDAPDIPPDFLPRGQPNKPEYLPRIAQTLATLRDMSLEEVAQVTTANALAVLPALMTSPL